MAHELVANYIADVTFAYVAAKRDLIYVSQRLEEGSFDLATYTAALANIRSLYDSAMDKATRAVGYEGREERGGSGTVTLTSGQISWINSYILEGGYGGFDHEFSEFLVPNESESDD